MCDASFTTKAHCTGRGGRISRSTVESHGGRVWAADNSPRGARFAFPYPSRPLRIVCSPPVIERPTYQSMRAEHQWVIAPLMNALLRSDHGRSKEKEYGGNC